MGWLKVGKAIPKPPVPKTLVLAFINCQKCVLTWGDKPHLVYSMTTTELEERLPFAAMLISK